MKRFTLLITLFSAFALFGQEKKEADLLISDASWTKEIIQMPLHFAPEIPYKGVEELRFSPDWSKQDREGFWTYAFVWNVDIDKQLTATAIETDLQYYFDGLMAGVNKDKGKVLPKTIALILKKESANDTVKFEGKLQIYNSFHTKDTMILYCTVTHYYCADKQQSMVLFRFSPKPFEHTIWNELNNIKVKKKPCED
ncbi:hypothetical protein [Kordia jejudonensis]|uniref:hypothetical protein n=1 Tax=Kordia jejudonensis TaxID=1348245 RepID=UPI0006291FDA|nr:hypothetical protein [Kordia jejudonensis]